MRKRDREEKETERERYTEKLPLWLCHRSQQTGEGYIVSSLRLSTKHLQGEASLKVREDHGDSRKRQTTGVA